MFLECASPPKSVLFDIRMRNLCRVLNGPSAFEPRLKRPADQQAEPRLKGPADQLGEYKGESLSSPRSDTETETLSLRVSPGDSKLNACRRLPVTVALAQSR